jgi:hypothetical protein
MQGAGRRRCTTNTAKDAVPNENGLFAANERFAVPM